mgnify:CR=1 FL=1
MASSDEIQYQIDRLERKLREAHSARDRAISRYRAASGNEVDRWARAIRDAESDIEDANSEIPRLKSSLRDAERREERDRQERRRRIEEDENRKRQDQSQGQKKGWFW